MEKEKKQEKIPFFSYDTVIVGTGAAGYAAADALRSLGQTDFAVLTEGRKMGTSRNTGSDKQTYYKLTTAGDEPDSVLDMAKTYFACGSMHGDIALVQAAESLRAFYHLVEIGVPFPYNEVGEYVGYKTDHDPRMRATSCGPLTSKYMTEALEKRVLSAGTPLYDGARVVKIFKQNDRICGLLALSPALISEGNPLGAALVAANHVVWATGGPAALYASSVYPESQTCAHGAAFEAGAVGINLTESQYGIASTAFRWNLSGTYQQVIPRYISTDADGNDEKEFLNPYFSSSSALLGAIFHKGYEWPFDPRKLGDGGSSTVDMAIYRERQSGRRVFLDFTKNPDAADRNGTFDFSLLPVDALSYLQKSDALLPAPIDRLRRMNPRAIELYAAHGIDLSRNRLEIDVCAQHNNGGLDADVWSESPTLPGFFPVGECAGTFGVTRPGGSALNATQVGARRAAEKIASEPSVPTVSENVLSEKAADALSSLLSLCKQTPCLSRDEILSRRTAYGKRMTRSGAFIRSRDAVRKALAETRAELSAWETDYAGTPAELLMDALINRDILLTQTVYLSAILSYIEDGGKSRGSYLVAENAEVSPTEKAEIDAVHAGQVQTALLKSDGTVSCAFAPVRPIPERELWFETVYNRK